MNISKSQLRKLRPYLVGEQPRENGDWDMYCPLHDDRRRSATLNVEEAVWVCHAGCGGGTVKDLMAQSDDWVAPRTNGAGPAKVRKQAKTEELPSPAAVEGWSRALLASHMELDDLVTSRGLYTETIARYKIGWNASQGVYTIPVYDEQGELANVRRYNPRPADDRRKIWGYTGHNEPRLFPIEQLKAEKVVVCEGEWDSLTTIQQGFAAVTRTGSAGTWRGAWNALFKGKVVYLCHDMDQAGQDANRRVGRHLLKVAKAVYVVRLPFPLAEKHGKDLSDFWMDHDADDFQRLLDEATPYDEGMSEDPEEVAPDDASVLDSFDSRKVGKPLRLTVTIKGKRGQGYSIPRKVRYQCTRDAGNMCKTCPLYASGDDRKVVAGTDPVVLEMVESSKKQLDGMNRALYPVPQKCAKVRVNVEEHQAVEVLYARPSVDHMTGTAEDASATDYTNVKIMSVGRHDTLANNTVQVVGALYPEPRKQLNEFMAWDVSRMETSVDRFDVTPETIELMNVFQPEPDQSPLAKLRDIADDLAATVTHIYGRPELHAAMDLVFHSALGFDFAGKRLARGWLELLVVGDTRTGKSEVASRLTRHYRVGEVVSCETASLAGILGGVQQPSGSDKVWTVTWGVLPINDRRLVVLDEVGGLSHEHIGALSSVRSSGIADIQKVQQERTSARTRLIWLGNPPNKRMSDYTWGVQAIPELIGNAEDIARFDLAMSVASGDVPATEINRRHENAGEPRYSSDACSALVHWVWSRTPDQVVWAKGAEQAVFKAASDLGRRYVEDPPLIQAANAREKVARLAVALAARTFSTDERHELIVVRRDHVTGAVRFLDALYKMEGFGYHERSKQAIADRREAEQYVREIKDYLYDNERLAKFLRGTSKFRRQDIEEVMEVDRESANAVIGKLWATRMVYKDKGDVRLTPTLHRVLREMTL